MAQEIERKFLVDGDFKKEAVECIHIAQGYLSSVPERTVRVRIKGDRGFLTVKGAAGDSGVSRFEWEMEIPVAEAEKLLELCEPGIIDKERFIVPAGSHLFEVDLFHGENEGLVVAEIELMAEDERFEKPSWLGREVTGERRYYNSILTKHPYGKWR